MRLSFSRPIAPNVDRINGSFPTEIPVDDKRIQKKIRKIQARETIASARNASHHGNMRLAQAQYEQAINFALDAERLGSRQAKSIVLTARNELFYLNTPLYAAGPYGTTSIWGAIAF